MQRRSHSVPALQENGDRVQEHVWVQGTMRKTLGRQKNPNGPERRSTWYKQHGMTESNSQLKHIVKNYLKKSCDPRAEQVIQGIRLFFKSEDKNVMSESLALKFRGELLEDIQHHLSLNADPRADHLIGVGVYLKPEDEKAVN